MKNKTHSTIHQKVTLTGFLIFFLLMLPFSFAGDYNDPWLFFPFDTDVDDINSTITTPTQNSATIESTAKLGAGSLLVNADGDVMDLSESWTWVDANFSVSVWIKFTSAPISDQCLLGVESNTDDQLYFQNNLIGYEGTSGGGHAQATTTITTGWKLYTWVIRNTNTVEIWENTTKIQNGASASDSLVVSQIGDCHGASYPMSAYIDNMIIYNYSLNSSDIEAIYNNNLGYNFTPEPPPVERVETIFLHKNRSVYDISLLKENEEFFIAANYTIDNVPNADATCNFTGENLSAHFFLESQTNYTINNSIDTLSLIWTETNTSAVQDRISFTVCRVGVAARQVQIYVNESLFHTIAGGVTPQCSLGNHTEINLTTALLSNVSANISVKCDSCGVNTQMVVLPIENELIHFERKFSKHSDNLTYNTTSTYYEYTSHMYEYSSSGTFNLNISCNDTLNNTNYTINDNAPVIDIISIDGVSYSDGMNIESTADTTIVIEVNGDVITQIVFNVTYANGTLIKTQTNNETMNLNQTELAIDGLYNISIYAIDDESNTTVKTGYFNINDTTNPTITWTDPLSDNSTSKTFNTSFQLILTLADLNLFAYEIVVINPSSTVKYNFTQTNINLTSVAFQQTVTPDALGTWLVNTTVADSHTAKNITPVPYTIDDKKLNFRYSKIKPNKEKIDDNITIEYTGIYDIKSTKIKHEIDRMTMEYEWFLLGDKFLSEVSHSFRVKANKLYYIENSNYSGHFVIFNDISRAWVDFEADEIKSYNVNSCGADCYDINMVTEPEEKIKFKSLGGLNEITETVSFNVNPLVATNTSINMTQCPTSLQQTVNFGMIHIIIFIMIIIALVWSWWALGVIPSIALIFLSIPLSACHTASGFALVSFGVIATITFSYKAMTQGYQGGMT